MRAGGAGAVAGTDNGRCEDASKRSLQALLSGHQLPPSAPPNAPRGHAAYAAAQGLAAAPQQPHAAAAPLGMDPTLQRLLQQGGLPTDPATIQRLVAQMGGLGQQG